MVRNVVVLGGGTAGLTAALTLKLRLPHLAVRVIRSAEIGVIAVGEGTTITFPQHFFEYLRIDPKLFHQLAEPTWKLGIRFLWGARREFLYSFGVEYAHRWEGLSRLNASYYDDDTLWLGPTTALMAHDRAFPRDANGMPRWHNTYAFHVENRKLVGALETLCERGGVAITDGTMREAERGPDGIAALHLESGEHVAADLFVDASGFRSELLGRALQEPYQSFASTLLCDRAVIAGWTRRGEPTKPYTTVETMNAGWCWQIEHEHFINRGYVYASSFISDEAALEEFRRTNPKLETEPRIVRFRSGRYERQWVGNVVAVGNASGFTEPLEATAIQVITWQSRTLADLLLDARGVPTPSVRRLFNLHNCGHWEEIRDFLAVHYRFNTRRDTPFWRTCREETALGAAEGIVQFFQENGPSMLASGTLVQASSPFGLEGYTALLVGQRVQQQRVWQASEGELRVWRNHLSGFAQQAANGLTVGEALRSIQVAAPGNLRARAS